MLEGAALGRGRAMPIYEYECQGCHAQFERYQQTWREQPRCPRCDSAEVERQLSTFAMSGVDKGSGGGGCGSCRPGPGGCGSCGGH